MFYAVLGMGQKHAYVNVDGERVHVCLGVGGWAFRATFARSDIVDVCRHSDQFGGWGAHGWRGRWLVNGSSRNIVKVELRDGCSGRLMRWFPVRLRTLLLSLEDPDAFVSDLRRESAPV